MKLVVKDLETEAKHAAIMAQFGTPLDASTRASLEDYGFDDSRPVGCMKWIWCQWLLQRPRAEIQLQVEPFVARGMQTYEMSTLFHKRPVHDLYLLHCAVFACGDTQLKQLAGLVVDGSGDGRHTPRNDGDLYASAWTGMLKYWILGDHERAASQSELLWPAYRFPSFKAAAKPLIVPWLKRDWASFRKQQDKDFEKSWVRARRDRIVKSETETETVVAVVSSIQQLWCWAHCGMAMLAHRAGVEVATDPYWFPPHALIA